MQSDFDLTDLHDSLAARFRPSGRLAAMIDDLPAPRPDAGRMREAMFDVLSTLVLRPPRFQAGDPVVAREADGEQRFAIVSKVYFFASWWRYVVVHDDGTEAVLCETELRPMVTHCGGASL